MESAKKMHGKLLEEEKQQKKLANLKKPRKQGWFKPGTEAAGSVVSSSTGYESRSQTPPQKVNDNYGMKNFSKYRPSFLRSLSQDDVRVKDFTKKTKLSFRSSANGVQKLIGGRSSQSVQELVGARERPIYTETNSMIEDTIYTQTNSMNDDTQRRALRREQAFLSCAEKLTKTWKEEREQQEVS